MSSDLTYNHLLLIDDQIDTILEPSSDRFRFSLTLRTGRSLAKMNPNLCLPPELALKHLEKLPRNWSGCTLKVLV